MERLGTIIYLIVFFFAAAFLALLVLHHLIPVWRAVLGIA